MNKHNSVDAGCSSDRRLYEVQGPGFGPRPPDSPNLAMTSKDETDNADGLFNGSKGLPLCQPPPGIPESVSDFHRVVFEERIPQEIENICGTKECKVCNKRISPGSLFLSLSLQS